MIHNWQFSDINQALPQLARQLATADEVGSRNGRVKELMHVGITLKEPTRREVLLSSRKASIAAQIAETMWVLSGRNDVEFLSHYLPRAADFSDDGLVWRAGYGPRIRNWETRSGATGFKPAPIDQWAFVVETLRADPLSRRAVINIWDPQVDTQPGKDLPCNDTLIFSSRLGYLDLHVTIRSNDLIWGWSGINAFEWSVMLEITASMLGLAVGRLHFSTVSLHTYATHWGKVDRLAEDRAVSTGDAAAFNSGDRQVRTIEDWDSLAEKWFALEEAIRVHGASRVQQPVDAFPDPMLRGWLRVIQWWWSGQDKYLAPLAANRLAAACNLSLQPPQRGGAPVASPQPQDVSGSSFVSYVTGLHIEKDAAYGTSWKRRGEMLGIMANIARKIDRLDAGASTSDETATDTAIDLLVYLAKYRTWIDDQSLDVEDAFRGVPMNSDTPDAANRVIAGLERADVGDFDRPKDAVLVEHLTADFETLEFEVTEGRDKDKVETVEKMLAQAYRLALMRWTLAKMGADEYRGADAD